MSLTFVHNMTNKLEQTNKSFDSKSLVSCLESEWTDSPKWPRNANGWCPRAQNYCISHNSQAVVHQWVGAARLGFSHSVQLLRETHRAKRSSVRVAILNVLTSSKPKSKCRTFNLIDSHGEITRTVRRFSVSHHLETFCDPLRAKTSDSMQANGILFAELWAVDKRRALKRGRSLIWTGQIIDLVGN